MEVHPVSLPLSLSCLVSVHSLCKAFPDKLFVGRHWTAVDSHVLLLKTSSTSTDHLSRFDKAIAG